MQVNVSSGAPQGSGPSPETGPRSNVTVQGVFQSSLSSANVVGLPNHTRYASVPVGAVQNRPPPAIVPSHARNISEPSNQFVKYQNNSQGNQLRHSSQVEQSAPHQITHFRSSSVPKSMPIVPRHETGSTATTTTAVPGQKIPQKFTPQVPNNVSNVNVNFYRAVPVNVVSSVPTIHCLNTLSNVQGNNVSNVQVLPLGSSFPQQQVYNFPATTTVGFSSPSSSGVNGTTQVILHNTQTSNTNSIQIPSNFQNVNNRNSLLSPQVVPVPTANNRSTVSTCTSIGGFLPPPPVTSSGQELVQNTKPSTTVVPMVNVQPSGTRTFSNASMNTMPLTQPQPPPNKPINEPLRTPRTFTSTEAQTDEISVLPPVSEPPSGNREQRRRERRERRHQRRVNNSGHRHTVEGSTQVNDRLPDILNSHLPPPYSTLPAGMPPQNVMNSMVPPPPLVPSHVMPPPPHGAVLQTVVPNNVVPPSGFVFPAPPPPQMGQVPLVQGPAPVAVPVPPPSGFRFPFPANGFRRGRFAEDPPKGCCGLLSWKPGSLRWFIALIALVAVCCVLVGTALGAMRPAGRDHLTVSLLMIGVGIVLVTVSGVAWRLTSHDSSTCRSMLGLGSTESVDVCARRFVPRLPPSYGRPHHPYAAMMYPEFQYRPPPPSYQASMQEYRLRLLLLDRGNTPQIQAGIQNAVSPPPTYRSHAGSLLRAPLSSRRDAAQSEYSCPPSYRSQNSTNRQGTIQSNSVLHSREQSLSLSESNHGGSVVNVVNILGSTEEDIALDNITLDSLKMEPETELNPVKMLLKGSSSDLEGSKDGNLVTIVQTSDQSPVIVTVSGSSQIDNNSTVQITEIPSEMEILAHL
ncbi:verprolin [Anoplophora glabripennis]|uniref:verprolin n=1 Tax=Anoplophora glabripennis TaxID=217634 RepID=UPI000873F553|nr:verprolin [Anoplophora glabripennis]